MQEDRVLCHYLRRHRLDQKTLERLCACRPTPGQLSTLPLNLLLPPPCSMRRKGGGEQAGSGLGSLCLRAGSGRVHKGPPLAGQDYLPPMPTPKRDIRAPAYAYSPTQQQWVPEGAWQQPTEAVAAGSPTPAALVFWLGRAGSARSSSGSAPAPTPVLRQQLLHLKRRTRQLIRHCERPKPVTSIPTCICEKHTHFS